jgi:endoglucanase
MEFILADGKKLVTESGKEILLKGFGLGGWLLPEGYMWKFYNDCDRPRKMEELIKTQCGEEYSIKFWERYLDNYITSKDIELIREWGFNSVRLPMNSRKLFETIGEEVRVIESEIKRIDELICWCENNDIYVILDMHGAPGGQTGANIDDCRMDKPELFMEEINQLHLIKMWNFLANRYSHKPCIAGYDLINEPLPNWFSEYNDLVYPLYLKIIKAIREVDKKHMIILEGVHWDTDFSIFEPMKVKMPDNNIMLQFHKYWNCPDRESIKHFLVWRDELNIPLFMGEGGENNIDWYVGMFSMLRKENISYSFWSYKKMDNINSPISFQKPKEWDKMLECVKGNSKLLKNEAIAIWDEFLKVISDFTINENVILAIESYVPVTIPAEYFTYGKGDGKQSGAKVRVESELDILFREDNNRCDEPDYRGHGGAVQQDSEKLMLLLHVGEEVGYEFGVRSMQRIRICISGRNLIKNDLKLLFELNLKCNNVVIPYREVKASKEVVEIETEIIRTGNYELRLMIKGEMELYNIQVVYQ